MTEPKTDAAQMQRAINEVALVKVLCTLLNRDDTTLYRWARDPRDTGPDNTGERGPIDLLLTMMAVLGIRGQRGHQVLEQLRAFLNAAIDEAKGESAPVQAITIHAVGSAAKEFGEFVAACENPEAVMKEGAEAIAAISAIMQAAAKRPSLRTVA